MPPILIHVSKMAPVGYRKWVYEIECVNWLYRERDRERERDNENEYAAPRV